MVADEHPNGHQEPAEPKKRPRGRPRKNLPDEPREAAVPEKRGPESPSKERMDEPEEAAVPKKRGRPKKLPDEPQEAAVPEKRGPQSPSKERMDEPEEAAVPKKRGRPKKLPTRTPTESPDESPDESPKYNSDESSGEYQELPVAPKRGRGRPRKERPAKTPSASPSRSHREISGQRTAEDASKPPVELLGEVSDQLALTSTAEDVLATIECFNSPTDDRSPSWDLEAVKTAFPLLPDSDTWTAADRAAALALSQRMSACDEHLLPGKQNVHMRLLYAGCLRAMRCLPEDIIGVAYGLRYKTPDDHPCGLYDWTEEFCESLHQLVVHPFWGGSMAPLALFLQYTVVLDTHDTRPWGAIPSRTHGQDAFVDNVLLESQFARIPLWEARARCAAQDFAEAAPANRLYDLLEYTIHEHYQEHPATRPEPRDDAYLVENRTLRILLEALDDISQIHVVAFVPSHSLAMSARLAGSANNFPRSDDWPEVREHCLLRDIEERMQAAKSLG